MGSGGRCQNVSNSSSDLVLGRLINPFSRQDQWLTATIVVWVEDSAEEVELGSVTFGSSELLTHAEARPKGMYTN